MLSLHELKRIVSASEYKENPPTAKQLRDYGIMIVQEELGQDTKIGAYQNGYALYQVGNHSTVFPIQPCRDYLYISGENVIHLSESFFSNKEWYLRLVLEGEDRLIRNHEEKERNWNVSYSSISEDWAVMGNLVESTMEDLVRQEAVTELLQILTERQKCIVQKYYLQEKTQTQISKELGISQQAVSAILSQAIKSLRKKYLTYPDFFGDAVRCGEGRL
ncbi:MAG: sigma-70 family RNA polymerase sigma factor [Lachnospiraceae bacterium]|nr:sigma-70 family RNA polymerase sigma factor [Lachnospiraceae bacterium]